MGRNIYAEVRRAEWNLINPKQRVRGQTLRLSAGGVLGLLVFGGLAVLPAAGQTVPAGFTPQFADPGPE